MRFLLECMMPCCVVTGSTQTVDVTAFGMESNGFADANAGVQKQLKFVGMNPMPLVIPLGDMISGPIK